MKVSVKAMHGTAMYTSENVMVELEVAIPGSFPVKTTKVRFWVDDVDPYAIHVNATDPVFMAKGGKLDDFTIVPVYKHQLMVEGDSV